MLRRHFLATAASALHAAPNKTTIQIRGDQFLINGTPTYKGRTFEGHRIEGLLLNTRMVQGIFDDENPESVHLWKYPGTGKWDPERNTREFIASMPLWKQHGVLCFDICLQGGNPQGYRRDQPWKNNAFRPDGSLKPAYMARLEKILDAADTLGMIPMVCLFYFGQDEFFSGDEAIRNAVRQSVQWLTARGYRNILLEIANECNNAKYEQPILKPARIAELFEVARKAMPAGLRYHVGTSFNGRTIPPSHLVEASDYLLLHGNGVKDPLFIGQMVRDTRQVKGYRPMPILFNEDDHFDFDKPVNNMLQAIQNYASWGLLDIEGYQSVPVNWGINTERKRQFFHLAKKVAGV